MENETLSLQAGVRMFQLLCFRADMENKTPKLLHCCANVSVVVSERTGNARLSLRISVEMREFRLDD